MLVIAFLQSEFGATITDAKFGCKTGFRVSKFIIRTVEGTNNGQESDGEESDYKEAGSETHREQKE